MQFIIQSTPASVSSARADVRSVQRVSGVSQALSVKSLTLKRSLDTARNNTHCFNPAEHKGCTRGKGARRRGKISEPSNVEITLNTIHWWRAVTERTNTFSCRRNNVLTPESVLLLMTWGVDRLYATKKKRASCQRCARASVSAAPHLFSANMLKEKSQVHVSIGADWTWRMCVKQAGPLEYWIMIPSRPSLAQERERRRRRSLNGKEVFCPNNGLLLSPPYALSVCHQPSTLFLNNWR